jgi:hypothetical protein
MGKALKLILNEMIRYLQTAFLLILLILTTGQQTYSQEMQPISAEDSPPIQPIKKEKKSTQLFNKNFKSWQVKYNFSGGFAGLNRDLLLRSDGQIIVSDQRKKVRKEIKASPEQLAKTRKLLENLQPLKSPTKPTQTCADCFQSQMMITLDKRTYAVDSNSLSAEDISYQNLNSFLSNLLNQALAS